MKNHPQWVTEFPEKTVILKTKIGQGGVMEVDNDQPKIMLSRGSNGFRVDG